MEFSKYLHVIDLSEEDVALYHSLLVETVFLKKYEYETIKRCIESHSLADGNEAIEEAVKYLFEQSFIVATPQRDEIVFQNALSVLGEQTLNNVYVVLTEACNFSCKYCFLAKALNGTTSRYMSKKVAKAMLVLLQKIYEKQAFVTAPTITFYGGEPLLNFQLIKYIFSEIENIKKTSFWPKDVRYAIITNGSLLTQEIILFMKEKKIALGISYDGERQANRNRLMKNGGAETTDNVLRNIELCHRYSLPFSLSTTITEEVIAHKTHVINNLLALAPEALSFNLLIPNPFQQQDDSYYERATDFMIDAFIFLREKGVYEDRMMRKVFAFINQSFYPYDCYAAGANQLVVTPKGELGVCHAFLNDRQYFNASVFDENFDYKSNRSFLYWRKRMPILMHECQTCVCLGICGGGCAYAAAYRNGSIYELDKGFCIQSKKILRWLLRDLWLSCTSQKSEISL